MSLSSSKLTVEFATNFPFLNLKNLLRRGWNGNSRFFPQMRSYLDYFPEYRGMDVSVSLIRHACLVAGMLVCLASGCSFSRNSLADRPTEMEPRVSVDDVLEENSGFEAVNSKTNAKTGARTLADRREKLRNWRNGSDVETTAEAEHPDKVDEVENSGQLAEKSSSNSDSAVFKSPFDRALAGGGRTKARGEKTRKSPDSEESSPNVDNPFVD